MTGLGVVLKMTAVCSIIRFCESTHPPFDIPFIMRVNKVKLLCSRDATRRCVYHVNVVDLGGFLLLIEVRLIVIWNVRAKCEWHELDTFESFINFSD